jgi:alkylation response protein AidB-like acyl-CoA dehydrogenase
MDLRHGREHEAFREELREFLASWSPPEAGERDAQEAAFRQQGIERGYVYRHFPTAYGGGGRERDVVIDTILQEEYSSSGAPGEAVGIGPAMLAPTLLEVGSEAQKQRFIPPTLRGDLTWCQGYSEPNAGSDLASLRSRATLDGDEWVLEGHKIWTSGAHQSDFMFGLFRSERDAPRNRGISYFLIDLRLPGIEIRPIVDLLDTAHFNEVFFDGVRVPADHLVGKRGEGWRVANVTLRHERSMIADIRWLTELFDSLVALAERTRTASGGSAIEQADTRRKLAEIDGYLASHVWTTRRLISAATRGRSDRTAQAGMMMKLAATRLRERCIQLGHDLVGDATLGAPDRALYKEAPHTDAEWTATCMRFLAHAIGGGTSNIQRNIIGERALGLPRDPLYR